jgi:hypothetical protein
MQYSAIKAKIFDYERASDPAHLRFDREHLKIDMKEKREKTGKNSRGHDTGDNTKAFGATEKPDQVLAKKFLGNQRLSWRKQRRSIMRELRQKALRDMK